MKKKTITILCAIIAAAPLCAQEDVTTATQNGGKNETGRLDDIRTEEGGINALDHLLQRPRVAKTYKDKKFMDHIFLDYGLGGNAIGRHGVKIGPMAEISLGDWISPEHGFRVNLYGGAYKISGKKVKYASAALDYMLNITAVATPGNDYRQKPFELYGIAGIDATYSRENGNNDHGFGAHLGMRGQVALSDISYFYMEPRVGVVQDNVSQVPSWRNLRPTASVSMGFGVRMPDVRKGGRNAGEPRGSFADGMFVSAMTGPMYLGSRYTHKWKRNRGMTAAVSVGKWLDYSNGLQLTLDATTFRQDRSNRMRAVGARLDYLLNLHNAFGGLNPDRKFWVNGLVGVGYNYSKDRASDSRYTWSTGAALQANVKLSRDISFILEPRIDIYNRKWAPHAYSFENIDATAALLAGFVYTYHEPFSRAAHGNEGDTKLRKSSFGLMGGATVRLFQYDRKERYMPMAKVYYTHWTAPLAGWRYSLQGIYGRPVDSRRFGAVTAGFDWMTDLTALTYGCDNSRILSVRTLAGFNIGADHSGNTRLSSNVHAGSQLALRLSRYVSLTAEGQLGYEFTPRYKGLRARRIQPQALIGVEYSLQRSSRNKDLDERPTLADYIFLSAGTGIYSGSMSKRTSFGKKLTILSDIGYGHWFSHVSGMQLSVGNTVVPSPNLASKTITSVRADYMMNLKSAVTGEATENDLVQLTGLIGASANFSTKKDRDNAFAPGLHAALQTGFRLTRHFELYFEPSATAFTKKIEGDHWCSPATVELRMSIGTKVNF